MQKLLSELSRLYLPAGALPPEGLEQRVLGHAALPVSLTGDGMTRAMVIPFRRMADGEEGAHWQLLCVVANALQSDLGLPAPAVSISGADGYSLWLSLQSPIPTARAQQFLESLRAAYFPGIDIDAGAPVELPPCLNQVTGRWAAFINPGLGASFADESGLEMAPPLAGQAALLEGLKSISEAQFARVINTLQPSMPAVSEPVPPRPAGAPGLLLQDATLEDIVRHLHAKNIEPTFRHLIRDRS